MRNSLISLFLCVIAGTAGFSQKAKTAGDYFYNEEFAEAAAAYQKSLSADKPDPESLFWFVINSLLHGNSAEADKAITQYKPTMGSSPWYLAAAGYRMFHKKNKAEAKNNFEDAIRLCGTDKELKTKILLMAGRSQGWLSMAQSDPDWGIAKLKLALTLKPELPEAFIAMGDCYRRKLEGGQAVMHYQKISEKLPALANYKLGLVYRTQDNCDVAAKYWNLSYNADPTFLPTCRGMFRMYADLAGACFNKAAAKTWSERYTALLSNETEKAILRAEFQLSLQEYKTAIAEAKKVEVKSGNHTSHRLYSVLASSNDALGNYTEALSWYEKIVSSSPEELVNSYVFRRMANCNMIAKKFEAAVDYFQKAAALETDQSKKVHILNSGGTELYKLKEYKSAAVLFELVIQNKDNVSASDLFYLGTCYYYIQALDEGIKVFSKYSEKFSSDWRGPLWSARCLALKDSLLTTGEAAPFYEKYITLGAADPANKKSTIEAYMYLFAVAYNLKKDKALALTFLDKVLALEPGNVTALNYREKLKQQP